jgi:hypothetical protein
MMDNMEESFLRTQSWATLRRRIARTGARSRGVTSQELRAAGRKKA